MGVDQLSDEVTVRINYLTGGSSIRIDIRVAVECTSIL